MSQCTSPGLLNAVPVVRHCQASLAVANPGRQLDADAPACVAQGVLDTVGDGLVPNEPERHSPVDRKLDLIGLDIDGDVLRLLLDRGAECAQVAGHVDDLQILPERELVMVWRIDSLSPQRKQELAPMGCVEGATENVTSGG